MPHLYPQLYFSITSALPQLYLSSTSALPQLYLSSTSALPQLYLSFTSALPQYSSGACCAALQLTRHMLFSHTPRTDIWTRKFLFTPDYAHSSLTGFQGQQVWLEEPAEGQAMICSATDAAQAATHSSPLCAVSVHHSLTVHEPESASSSIVENLKHYSPYLGTVRIVRVTMSNIELRA